MADTPEIHVLGQKVRLLQPGEGFRTSLDSVFAASACPAKPGEHVLDMGCGVGGASFCLLWRVPRSRITGVDIQASHIDLAVRNIELNSAGGRASFICADIRDFRPAERFDHVVCNPPFLEAGTYTPSSSPERAAALGHHGTDLTLQEWIDAGFHCVRPSGSLTIIHRADHVDRIVQALGRKFGAIEIFPLYPRAGEEAKRVIVRAVRDRRSPSRIAPGLILHETDGSYTRAADAILRDGAATG